MDVITDSERRTLIAEQDMLESVIALAAAPGRVCRGDLDDLLLADRARRAVPGRPRLVPFPRGRPQG